MIIIISRQIWLQIIIRNAKNLQLHNIKYFYRVRIIFEHFYLTDRWQPINQGELWNNSKDHSFKYVSLSSC